MCLCITIIYDCSAHGFLIFGWHRLLCGKPIFGGCAPRLYLFQASRSQPSPSRSFAVTRLLLHGNLDLLNLVVLGVLWLLSSSEIMPVVKSPTLGAKNSTSTPEVEFVTLSAGVLIDGDTSRLLCLAFPLSALRRSFDNSTKPCLAFPLSPLRRSWS